MQPQQLDIRLLAVFDALLTEQNVTRAAQYVNLSQSAASKALLRLRDVFEDPLFLRTRGGVAPTHRALELAPLVRDALEASRRLLDPQSTFDPARATTVFNIAASDYVTSVVMPSLQEILGRDAPGTRLAVQDLEHYMPEDVLLSGKVDLALAPVTHATRPLNRQALFQDSYVCIAGRSHPGIRDKITLKQFVALGHLVIPRQNGGVTSIVDDALAQRGLSRKIAATIPHYLSLPSILQRSQLVSTVPSRMGQFMARHFSIDVYPHPVKLTPFSVSAIWHTRTDGSPAQQWLRRIIVQICRTI